MIAEKEELKAAGVLETTGMVQSGLSSCKHRTVLAHGEIAALQSMGQWFDGYLDQLNTELAAGKIDDAEIVVAKRHLTKVGEQITHRAAACALELRHIEGEVRAFQGLGLALEKRLELAQVRIEKAKQEAEETEERRLENAEGAAEEGNPNGINE